MEHLSGVKEAQIPASLSKRQFSTRNEIVVAVPTDPPPAAAE
jgi:hypothetical protein